MTRVAFLLALALLIGCSPPDSNEASAPDALANEPAANLPAQPANQAAARDPADPGPDVILEGETLLVDAGHGMRLALDRSTLAEVEAAMQHSGTPKREEGPEDCPAGKLTFLTYPNGLQLAIQDGKLAGYWVKQGSRGVTGPGGIAPGSPRTMLGNAPTMVTSFAKLVTVDGVNAILDEEETRITDLYAGAACIYD